MDSANTLARQFLLKVANCLPLQARRSISRWPIIGPCQGRLFRTVFNSSQIEAYQITAGPASGLQLALKLPQERLYWLGVYELPVAERLAAEVRAGDVCWDVGAYIGFFSAIMAHKSAACVSCFEPLSDNRDRLAMQAGLNKHLNLSILPLALSSEEGVAEFLVASEATMGKLAESTFQEAIRPSRRIMVETTTIDRVIESGRAAPPTLIKIDTEGAEYGILAGGMSTLERYHPRILLEYHGCPDDRRLLELLSSCDYRCEVVETNEPLALHGVQPGQHLWCT